MIDGLVKAVPGEVVSESRELDVKALVALGRIPSILDVEVVVTLLVGLPWMPEVERGG